MTKYEYPELDEVLYRDSLPNGLQIAVVPGGALKKDCLPGHRLWLHPYKLHPGRGGIHRPRRCCPLSGA